MSLEDDLELERYKLVTGLQKYFTELARDCFSSYVKLFSSFVAGAVALIYFEQQIKVDPNIIVSLLKAISILVSVLAIFAIGQIIFCLVRWYGLRHTEREINSKCPPPEFWAWVFEGLYIFAITVSVIVLWIGYCQFSKILLNMI